MGIKVTVESGTPNEEVLRELERYNNALTTNPLLGYIPHAKQGIFHASSDKVKAFIGGNRSGKTTASIVDSLIQTLPEKYLPEMLVPFKHHHGPYCCRVITPDFTSTMEGVVFQKIHDWVPPSALKGGNWEKAYSKQRRRLMFEDGGWWDFLTYEQDLDKFGGAALDRVVYDEEPPGEKGEQIRSECRARLIDRAGDEVFAFTPLLGLSWAYDAIWEKRLEPGITVVQVDMDDNPHLDPQAKKDYLDNIATKEERDARKSGKFVHFGGVFFSEFNDNDHVAAAPPATHLKDQTIVVGIDPGFRRTGVVWVAFDNDNSALVFDEFYPEELVVEPIAAEIHARNRAWGIKPLYVIDPSARNRATINAFGVEGEFAKEGVYCQHGQNDRAAGILELKGRLQDNRLIISRDCRKLVWEIGRYRRDTKSSDEFAAIKRDDHLVDALRYAVMSRTWGQPKPLTGRKRPSFGERPDYEPPYKPSPLIPESSPMGTFT